MMGAFGDNRRSSAAESRSTVCLAVERSGTITAKGLPNRFLRRRSLVTASDESARQAS